MKFEGLALRDGFLIYIWFYLPGSYVLSRLCSENAKGWRTRAPTVLQGTGIPAALAHDAYKRYKAMVKAVIPAIVGLMVRAPVVAVVVKAEEEATNKSVKVSVG